MSLFILAVTSGANSFDLSGLPTASKAFLMAFSIFWLSKSTNEPLRLITLIIIICLPEP